MMDTSLTVARNSVRPRWSSLHIQGGSSSSAQVLKVQPSRPAVMLDLTGLDQAVTGSTAKMKFLFNSSDSSDRLEGAEVALVDLPTQEQILAPMNPLQRWRYLVKQRSRTLLFLLVTMVAWLFAVAGSWANVLSSLVRSAYASDTPSNAAQAYFNPQDVLLVFLGLMIVGALVLIFFAKHEAKIKSGDDTIKVAMGIIVGFFGSKAT